MGNQTITETAKFELRKAILTGDIPPGTRLVPAKLEQKFNLSRICIREAIKELTGTGIVESASQRGATIARPVEFSELREIFDIRYQLEGRASFLGTQKISDSDIIKMEILHNKIDHNNEIELSDFLLNQEFHMILYRASGWRYLIKAIERIFDQVLLFRSSLYNRYGNNTKCVVYDEEYQKDYVVEHNKILASLRERNPKKVQKNMVDHIKKQGFDNIYRLYEIVIQKESTEVGE
jgi:DNA-binding GntR family transcriptional regulator